MLQRAAIVLMLLSVSFLAAGSISDQDKLSCYVTLQPTDSLQQAVDMAPPSATICLQPGVYQQGNIRVDNAWLTLRGAGTGKTLIVGSCSISWSSEVKLRGRPEPSTREVRFQDLTMLPPAEGTSAAILTIHSPRYKPGRIILEGVELLGDPQPLFRYSIDVKGIVLVNEMELEVSHSAFYRFETAIETQVLDAASSSKIKVANSAFFENVKAIYAVGSLDLMASRVEHNGLGVILNGAQALIKQTVIAEQGGGGISITGDSHVRIEDSQIVRNGVGNLWAPVYSVDQVLDPFDILRSSGIVIYGKLPSEEKKPKIVLSVRGGMIQENVGWGIGAALAKCGNFAGEDEEFDVQVTLDDVEISKNNRNWLMEGDTCLP